MSRQTPKEQGHEKLGANRFGVTTQGISVMTRTRLLIEIYVQHLYSMSQHKSRTSPKKRSRKKNAKLRHRKRQRLEVLSRQNFLCHDKETNLGQNFGVHNVINEVSPNIAKPIYTHF